jgi:hypothetical protein
LNVGRDDGICHAHLPLSGATVIPKSWWCGEHQVSKPETSREKIHRMIHGDQAGGASTR